MGQGACLVSDWIFACYTLFFVAIICSFAKTIEKKNNRRYYKIGSFFN